MGNFLKAAATIFGFSAAATVVSCDAGNSSSGWKKCVSESYSGLIAGGRYSQAMQSAGQSNDVGLALDSTVEYLQFLTDHRELFNSLIPDSGDTETLRLASSYVDSVDSAVEACASVVNTLKVRSITGAGAAPGDFWLEVYGNLAPISSMSRAMEAFTERCKAKGYWTPADEELILKEMTS